MGTHILIPVSSGHPQVLVPPGHGPPPAKGPHIAGRIVRLLQGEAGSGLGAQLLPFPLEPFDGRFARELLPVHLGRDHHVLPWRREGGLERLWGDLLHPPPSDLHSIPPPSDLCSFSLLHQTRTPRSELLRSKPQPLLLEAPHQSPPTQCLASSGTCRKVLQRQETGPQVGGPLHRR